MRTDPDLDQRVAGFGPRAARRAFALQPQDLTIGHAFRDGQIEHAAIGQRHALFGAEHGFEKIDFQRIAEILTANGEAAAFAAAGWASSEYVREDVGKAEIVKSAAAWMSTARADAPGLSATPGARCPAPLRPARIAFGVDFAGIVLPALFRVAQNVVGGGDFLETLRGGRIVGIDVGMVGFREFAECAADFILCGAARDAQDVVEVFRHEAVLSCKLPGQSIRKCCVASEAYRAFNR